MATTTASAAIHYPPELLTKICAHIYDACLQPSQSSLDPLLISPRESSAPPHSLPSSFPPAYWPEQIGRHSLASLCLVNHAWYTAAKPFLWRKLEVRLPRSWLVLLEQISWDYEEETVDHVMETTVRAAAKAAALASSSGQSQDYEVAQKILEEGILDSIGLPEETISPDLLSPAASRDPSPRRIRHKSKSPARWELLRSISNALEDIMRESNPSVYVPTPHDPRPGRFVHRLDFNHFRTIGMRRSVEEGVNSRFVTGDRVEAVLKELPNLTSFGATEYMDGALTLPVLNELFLRGVPSQGRGRPSRGRALIDVHDAELENAERRRQCKDIEAVDFTGCVSAIFVNAFSEFVQAHLLPSSDPASSDRGRGREEPLTLPGLQRLCLRSVKSVGPSLLTPFVLAFPSLTHLDLSGTHATPELLASLAASDSVRLTSLGLSRCVRLTGESIKHLLVNSLATSNLQELNLYGDLTFGSPLTEDDLHEIVTQAPCFVRGQLVYLDLSSAPITDELLVDDFPRQPALRSFGISYIPNLSITAIGNYLRAKATNVEVLTLISTSPELDCGLRPSPAGVRGSAMKSSIALHSHLIQPLCTTRVSIMGVKTLAPTRLRVIELSSVMLGALGVGAGSWRVIRSKGGRGWYVDTASGWAVPAGEQHTSDEGVFSRDLPHDHPLRREFERLADANGNVSAGTGWHARKMEVLQGSGMLGREDGLYGAVSFAYQG